MAFLGVITRQIMRRDRRVGGRKKKRMATIAKTDRLLRRVVIICEIWLLRKTAVVKGGCCEGRLNRQLIRVAKIENCEGWRTLL